MSQFKANKDNRTGEQILEDIHAESRMPTLQWLLAETIYDELKRDGMLVYKAGIYPPFNKLDKVYKQRLLNLAKKILGETVNDNKRKSRRAS